MKLRAFLERGSSSIHLILPFHVLPCFVYILSIITKQFNKELKDTI